MDARTTFPLTEATRRHGRARQRLRLRRDQRRRTRARRARHPPRHPPRHASSAPGRPSRQGGSLVIVAPHDPKPLLAQLADRGPLTVTYLDEGPDAWRLKLTRA